MVALLKNAVLWLSFVQMGSCGLLRFKYKEKKRKKNLYLRVFSRKKINVMWVVGLTDNLILWAVGVK